MSILQEIEDGQFGEKVLKSSLPALVDFNSPECIICKTMNERIREVAVHFKGKVNFFSVDVNKNKIWEQFDVKSVPTVLYFKDGKVVFHHEHFPEKEEMKSHLHKLLQI
ncbi:MAG: thioredoxin family protein [Candidatus Omnitrophota bacterium]|nr:thioredoxin family protein [Candidatus Omnitrophota bacterium]